MPRFLRRRSITVYRVPLGGRLIGKWMITVQWSGKRIEGEPLCVVEIR